MEKDAVVPYLQRNVAIMFSCCLFNLLNKIKRLNLFYFYFSAQLILKMMDAHAENHKVFMQKALMEEEQEIYSHAEKVKKMQVYAILSVKMDLME